MDKKELVSSFQKLELHEVKSLIQHLKEVEEGFYKEDGEHTPEQLTDDSKNKNDVCTSKSNGGGPQECTTVFDNVPLLNYDHLLNEPIESWLMPAPVKEGEPANRRLDDLQIDSRLMGVRVRLLNYVRAAINEERADAITSASLKLPVKLKRNSSYVIRRDNELSTASPALNPHPTIHGSPRATSASYVTLAGPTIYTPQGLPITLPVITDSNTIFTTSPPSTLNTTLTYSAKRHGHFSHNGTPKVSYKSNGGSGANDLYSLFQDHSPIGLNTTFSTCPNDSPDDTYSHPARVHVTPPRVLNSTFAQSPEDSGSMDNMDEIHSLARMQEQSLHVSTSPRRLERRGTHTIVRGSSINDDTDEYEPGAPRRKLSNDTYSLEESSPASGGSSAISSPRDAQSYENVQMASESVRRSMPNLAHIGLKKFSAIPAPPSQLRREPYYVSDPKIGRTRTRTLRGPTPGIQPNCIDPIEVPQAETVCIEARPYSANNSAYVRSNTFQKSNKPLSLKKSEEDLYSRNRPGSEGTGTNSYSGRPSSIKPPSRPSALPSTRYSSQNREKDVPHQYAGIPRPRTGVARGSMLPTTMYSVPGGSLARPDTSRY